MYSDKDRQREANRERARRYRAKHKGVTHRPESNAQSVTPEQGTVTPEGRAQSVPANYGQPDCECYHCRNNRKSGSKLIINHGAYKTAAQLADNEVNRVSLPGDVDYD